MPSFQDTMKNDVTAEIEIAPERAEDDIVAQTDR
jgi:hypothetical protein